MFPLYACADRLNMLPRTRSLPSHEGMYVIEYTIHFIRVLLRAVLTEHWFMWCESMRGAARAPLATSHCNYRLQLAACQISLLIMLQCWEAFALLQLSVLRLPELNASARACQRHSKTLKPILVRWCAGIIGHFFPIHHKRWLMVWQCNAGPTHHCPPQQCSTSLPVML